MATPDQPRNVQVEVVGARALFFDVGGTTDDGGRPILNYRITLSDSIHTFSLDISSNTFSVLIRRMELVENTTYT